MWLLLEIQIWEAMSSFIGIKLHHSFTYKPTLSAFILHKHGELCSGDSLVCHALDVY